MDGIDKLTRHEYNRGMTIKVYVYQCKRCQHEWPSRLARPHICPKCKSPYYDTPRTRPPRAKAKPEPAPALDDSFNPIVKVARQLQGDGKDG